MTHQNFSILASETLDDILDRLAAIDALDDLDYDLIDGVLTIEFDDGSTLIFNRQEAAQQFWLASPEGPAHFSYDPEHKIWIDDRNQGELIETLNRILSQKIGESISL